MDIKLNVRIAQPCSISEAYPLSGFFVPDSLECSYYTMFFVLLKVFYIERQM